MRYGFRNIVIKNTRIGLPVTLITSLLGLCFIASSQPFKKQTSFKEYLLQNIDKVDFIEGIWEFNQRTETGWHDKDYDYKKLPPTSFNIQILPYRIAIIKTGDSRYRCYPISTVDQFTDKISERNANSCDDFMFELTAIEGQYLYSNLSNSCKSHLDCKGKAYIKQDGDLYFECKQEEFKGGIRSWNNFYLTATKLSPTQAEIRNWKAKTENTITEAKPTFSFGTGSAISRDLVLTCYHIVKDAKQISLRGINGKFDTTYSARLNFYDEDLDIAVLKIQIPIIKTNSGLPYSFKKANSEVGESIFVLGYPLQNTMGQEIKLTTGVISSNSGFLGDTSLFQISAPIQPGNSGGPLFDNYGNLIGIVSAKHKRADNVGYAVKLSLFQDFLKRKGVNFSSNKNVPAELSKQVKSFKDFIYSIEVALE
jgi:hypothetical protein